MFYLFYNSVKGASGLSGGGSLCLGSQQEIRFYRPEGQRLSNLSIQSRRHDVCEAVRQKEEEEKKSFVITEKKKKIDARNVKWDESLRALAFQILRRSKVTLCS